MIDVNRKAKALMANALQEKAAELRLRVVTLALGEFRKTEPMPSLGQRVLRRLKSFAERLE